MKSFFNKYRESKKSPIDTLNKSNNILSEEKEIEVESTEEITQVVDESENVVKNAVEEKIESKVQPERKIIRVCKIGSDHCFANMNNHDFAFNLLNMKVVTDGCGSGKHSEVGTKIFGQLFARKCKEFFDKGEKICEENFIEVVNNIFSKMLELSDDTTFIFQNYCFTILVCFEFEEEFVVYSCGDGYIIKENDEGITFEVLDDGEYPCYYIYNFIKDKNVLKEYKDGVTFTVSRFSKKDYINIGVATDGLRYAENLLEVEKNKFMKYLHEGKGPQIEVLINRNNRKNEMFHDDISICF